MKEYNIYWIKEEYARHYYYKSDILYRFIIEYHLKNFRNDLVTQFSFITENFPKELLLSQLVRQPTITIKRKNNGNKVELGNKNNFITLHIEQKQIKFRCETLQDAESLLFPTLRSFYPFLFIVDEHYENYGWISPIKLGIGYNNEQVLYS